MALGFAVALIILLAADGRAMGGAPDPAYFPLTRITVLYDNVPYSDQCRPQWGFSCLIEGGGKTLLFDTGGDGAVLLENMATLGVDPAKIDRVVLSHSHWDHSVGLEDFLKKRGPVPVHIPASLPKLHKHDLRQLGAQLVDVSIPAVILPGVHTTGEMGQAIKEQSLILRTTEGMIVITGCAHPGIVEIVKSARGQFSEPVLLVMGGFHLLNTGAAQVKAIAAALRELGVLHVAPSHCTGDEAIQIFAGEFGERFVRSGVGGMLSPEDLK